MRRRAAFVLAIGLLAAPAASPEPETRLVIDAIPMGPSAEERLEEIRRRVQAAVVYPERARRRGLEGTTRIQFLVGNEGLAEGIETVESSGWPILDRAAEASARDAGALPPIYGWVRIPVRFEVDPAPH